MGDGDGGGTIAMGNDGSAMDGGTACDGQRRNVRRDGSANGSAIAMDGGSDKTLLNLECAMALGLPQFLVRKGRLCVTEKKPKTSIPILVWGLPESVWVGICQYSKSRSPHSAMGFIPIWGPTYISCSCTSRTKRKMQRWKKSAQRILDLLFDKTDHDGNFSAIKFGAKSNTSNRRSESLSLNLD